MFKVLFKRSYFRQKTFFLLVLVILNFGLVKTKLNGESSTQFTVSIKNQSVIRSSSYSDWYTVFVNQLNSQDLLTEDYNEVKFHSAFIDVVTSAKYWPEELSINKEDYLDSSVGQITVSTPTEFNGSLLIFDPSYLNYNTPFLTESLLFSLVNSLNVSTEYYSWFYGNSPVGTIEKFIDASLSTLLLREIDGKIVGRTFDYVNNYSSISNLRSALKWLDYSFNTSLLVTTIQKQIDSLSTVIFPNWYSTAAYGLLCIETGEEFSNSSLVNFGESVIEDLWNNKEFINDNDFEGYKFAIALDLVDYNNSYAKEITDFGISLLFSNMGVDLLQPMVASQVYYDFLINGTLEDITTYYNIFDLFGLMEVLDEYYPEENYPTIQRKIMNFYFSICYYSSELDRYTMDYSTQTSLLQNGYYSNHSCLIKGHLFCLAKLLGQYCSEFGTINDTETPILETFYATGSETVFTDNDVFINSQFKTTDNNFTFTASHETEEYFLLKIVINDELSGFMDSKFVIDNSSIFFPCNNSINTLLPFQYTNHTVNSVIKKNFDQSIFYYLYQYPEMLVTKAFVLHAYDKVGNVRMSTIIFMPITTYNEGSSYIIGIDSISILTLFGIATVIIWRTLEERVKRG